MKKLLLISGDLATGKSRFAGILSQRYGITVMYKDKIKEILGDTVGFKDREENLKLSYATMELMTYGFSELAMLGGDLILEANFKGYELSKLHEIAKNAGYRVLTLVLRADMEIIYQRFVNRIEKEGRHPVHISGFDGYDSFKSYVEKSRKENILGASIIIDADDFSYQTDEGLLSEIDEFMGESHENH